MKECWVNVYNDKQLLGSIWNNRRDAEETANRSYILYSGYIKVICRLHVKLKEPKYERSYSQAEV